MLMTLKEARELIETEDEMEQQRHEITAEIGSGAYSLGLDPYDAMWQASWEMIEQNNHFLNSPEGIEHLRRLKIAKETASMFHDLELFDETEPFMLRFMQDKMIPEYYPYGRPIEDQDIPF